MFLTLVIALVMFAGPSFVSTALTEVEEKTSVNTMSISLENNFDVSIVKPLGYVYFLNTEIASLLPVLPVDAIIVGWITVEVDVQNGPIEKVEFYVDNMLRETDTESPYEWKWDEHSLIPPVHFLKVIGYSGENTDVDEIFVVYINPFRPPWPPMP